jgi:hypothetical protein
MDIKHSKVKGSAQRRIDMMSNPLPSSCSNCVENLATAPQGDLSSVDRDILNDQCWLEMFRHTLLQSDQCARDMLRERFSEVVRGWVRLHPRGEEACRFEKEEHYVAQTFECFWQVTGHKELEFGTLAAVLRYLQASLDGVIVETLRLYSCQGEVSRLEPGPLREPITPVHGNSDQVWENIRSLLPGIREHRLAYLLFHCGLRPREIVDFYPQDFSDVGEISRLRHTVLEQVLLHSDQVS